MDQIADRISGLEDKVDNIRRCRWR
jgi:hypothetical protein